MKIGQRTPFWLTSAFEMPIDLLEPDLGAGGGMEFRALLERRYGK